MTLIFALGFATMFGAGSYLLLKHDLIRVVAGMVLISNAANLFIMSTGLTRGREPIYPLPAGESIADPLVQAMTLTAIVISFGVAALLMSIVYRVYLSHRSVDLDALAVAEERDASMADEPTLTPVTTLTPTPSPALQERGATLMSNAPPLPRLGEGVGGWGRS